jgi:hypothetical protein
MVCGSWMFGLGFLHLIYNVTLHFLFLLIRFNSCVETASCGVFVTREIYTLKFLVLSTRDLLGVISLYRQ